MGAYEMAHKTTLIIPGLALALATLSLAPAARAVGEDSLVVREVVASSSRSGSPTDDHGPARLVDRDPTTTWQPAGRSPRFAWVRFDLATTARVDGLVITHGPPSVDGTRDTFNATGRIRSAWILFDDGEAEVIRLDPHRRGPRRIILARLHTTRSVTLVIRDFELGERWNHLSLAEVAITGRPDGAAPESASDAAPTCGTRDWRPLRDAVVSYCGAAETAADCEDPLLDIILACRSDDALPLPALPVPLPSAPFHWSYRGQWFNADLVLRAADATHLRVDDVTLTEAPPAPTR